LKSCKTSQTRQTNDIASWPTALLHYLMQPASSPPNGATPQQYIYRITLILLETCKMPPEPTPPATVKTRLFIISDTHSSAAGNQTLPEWSFKAPFPEADVLIHTGDLTSVGRLREYQSSIALLSAIPAKLKLVIPGNHDLSLDKDYYLAFKAAILQHQRDYHTSNPDQALALWTSPEARDAGIHYLTEGLHHFDLANGASLSVYASPWQPECTSPSLLRRIALTLGVYNWAFNYAANEDRWNPPALRSSAPFPKDPKLPVVEPARPGVPIPEGAQVDVVMTHGPPWRHLDRTSRGGVYAGCPQLLSAMERVRPLVHCFGHIHEVSII